MFNKSRRNWRVFRTELINREPVRFQRFGAGARREEGEYLHGSLTDEQHRPSLKDRQSSVEDPRGIFSFVTPCQRPASTQRTHSLFMSWVLRSFSHPFRIGAFAEILVAFALIRCSGNHRVNEAVSLHQHGVENFAVRIFFEQKLNLAVTGIMNL